MQYYFNHYHMFVNVINLIVLFFVSAYNGLSGLVLSVIVQGLFFIIYPPLLLFTTPINLIFVARPLRRFMITAPLMQFIVKMKLLPKISETEKVALEAGTTWIDSEFFSGRINYTRIINEQYPVLSYDERNFLDTDVEEVCNMVDDWKIQELNDMPEEVWSYLRKNKFFGMNIPKKYGGLEFSSFAQSTVVAKLATRSQVLSITTMVPNSLGPAELIMKYGTPKQKSHYMPRLANGDDIPAFGLTEPNAGTDAASISSHGILFLDADGHLKVRLNFEKRYITLGGIATVIGLAFVLEDPDLLLDESHKVGITCALIKGDAIGLKRGRRHNPMGTSFVNSPLWGEDIIISVEDDIIGGFNGVGKGWLMLMECLSVGRGISLPAISVGGAKFASKVALYYSGIRKQFGLPLVKFEGIQEKLARMIANTYAIDAMRTFTAGAVNSGFRPSVINAIAKYHTTEMSREVINAGMDILGGSGICKGPHNLLASFYTSVPIGITVEGANIVTRTLLQFGQGLIRCHPFILKELAALAQNDIKIFDNAFFDHIHYIIRNRVRMAVLSMTGGRSSRPFGKNIITKYQRKLTEITAAFAFLSDAALIIYGGNLKRKEQMSGRFADIASYMYIMLSVMRRFIAEGQPDNDKPILQFLLDDYLNKIDIAFDGIYANFPKKSFMHNFCYRRFGRGYTMDQDVLNIIKNVCENEGTIFDDIFYPKTGQFANLCYVYENRTKYDDIMKALKKYGFADVKSALQQAAISAEDADFATKYNVILADVLSVDHFELKPTIH